eukprot:4808757-Alexandrium_andersonii.AAC.1
MPRRGHDDPPTPHGGRRSASMPPMPRQQAGKASRAEPATASTGAEAGIRRGKHETAHAVGAAPSGGAASKIAAPGNGAA